MFKIIPVMQYQNTLSANLYFQSKNIGGIGKDFCKEEVKFQYAEDFK